MPCTAVYFRNRSTLACLSCSSRVSTAAGPRSPVIASTIDWRVSGDRDGAMAKVALRVAVVSADEGAAVDHQDVAGDVIRGPAGQAVPRRDGIDLDVIVRQLVAVGLGETRDPGLGRGVGR